MAVILSLMSWSTVLEDSVYRGQGAGEIHGDKFGTCTKVEDAGLPPGSRSLTKLI